MRCLGAGPSYAEPSEDMCAYSSLSLPSPSTGLRMISFDGAQDDIPLYGRGGSGDGGEDVLRCELTAEPVVAIINP
jgi:hypothetical protein